MLQSEYHSAIRGQRAQSCLVLASQGGVHLSGWVRGWCVFIAPSAWRCAQNGCLVRMRDGGLNGSTVRVAAFQAEDVGEEEPFPGNRNQEQSRNAGSSQRTSRMGTWEELRALISVLGINTTCTQNWPPRSPQANDQGTPCCREPIPSWSAAQRCRGMLLSEPLPSRPRRGEQSTKAQDLL